MKRRQPFPYQRPALEYAAATRHPALFMEMRLGKCFVTIRDVISKGCQRVLIVCPLSVVNTWVDELHAEGERCIVPIVGTRAQRLELAALSVSRRAWFIVGYESLRETPELGGCHWSKQRRLMNGSSVDFEWDAVVLDESTTIRNPSAAVTKVACKGFRGAPHRFALTGYPNPEGPADFFSQFKFLDSRFMGFKEFWPWQDAKFFRTFDDGWAPKKGTKDAVRAEIRNRAFVLTRKQAGIANRKVYQKRSVAMSSAQKKAYQELVKDFIIHAPERKLAKYTVQRMTWLHQIAGGFNPDGTVLGRGKLNELRTLLTGELAKEPVLVWFRFNHELHEAQQVLKKAGVSLEVITGETSRASRRGIRDKLFRGSVRVLLLQQRAAHFGLDFSASSTEIFYSNYMDREVRAQAEDRVAHPSKSDTLLVIDLLTQDTVDESIHELLQDKRIRSKDYTRRLASEILKQ